MYLKIKFMNKETAGGIPYPVMHVIVSIFACNTEKGKSTISSFILAGTLKLPPFPAKLSLLIYFQNNY